MVGGMHGRGGMHRRGACMAGGMHGICTPFRWILQDAVNERVVRILLECILVYPAIKKPNLPPTTFSLLCYCKTLPLRMFAMPNTARQRQCVPLDTAMQDHCDNCLLEFPMQFWQSE